MDKFELLCLLEAISNYAYDIHYTANGRFFFSDHLFSERLSDIDVKDDFIETFYLGKSQEAPASADIARKVADLTPEITENEQDNFKRLRNMIIRALMGIQGYDGTKGEEDLLGSVAHILQRHNGLLYRQLTYTPEEIRNDDDDWRDIVSEEDTTQTLENEKWITVHPNKENPDDYRRLKVEDGETSKEAVERKFGKDDKNTDEDKKEPEKDDKEEKKDKPEEKLRDYFVVNPDRKYKDFLKFHGWDGDEDGIASEKTFNEIKNILEKYDSDVDNKDAIKEIGDLPIDAESATDVIDYILDPIDEVKQKTKISDVIIDDSELRNIEKKISKLNHEELIVFDKNGKKIPLTDNGDYELEGNSNRVNLSDEQLRKINNKVLTHNHPNGNVFSSADLFSGFGKARVAELRAVTPNGTVYSLRPLENANIKKLLPEYQQTEQKAERLFREKLDREFKSGIISAEEKKKALYNDFDKYCDEKLLTMFRNKSKDFGFEFKEYKQDD